MSISVPNRPVAEPDHDGWDARNTLMVRGADRYVRTCRDILRHDFKPLLFGNNANRTNLNIDLMPSDRTKPGAGQVFFGLRATERISSSDGYEISNISVDVAVTLRTGDIPGDRTARVAWVDDIQREHGFKYALHVISEGVIASLHQNPLVFSHTNGLIEFASQPPLQTPLYLMTMTDPKEVGPEHFHAMEGDNEDRTEVGLFQLISFGGGMQYRTLQVGSSTLYPH